MFLENHYFGTYDECARCWRERDLICMTPERVVSWGREGGRPPDYMLGVEYFNLKNCMSYKKPK